MEKIVALIREPVDFIFAIISFVSNSKEPDSSNIPPRAVAMISKPIVLSIDIRPPAFNKVSTVSIPEVPEKPVVIVCIRVETP